MAEQSGKLGLDMLFRQMPGLGASDLHLKAGNPPIYRIDGLLHRTKADALSAEELEALVRELLGDERLEQLREEGSVDLGRDIEGGRVRISIFLQKGRIGLTARLLTADIPSLEELHLPPALARIADIRQGLVLVCGVTGCGKSTTLAALIEMISKKYRYHILTIEDPIEYLHRDAKSIVNQREIGLDCLDWQKALRAAVRADPDVILVGEMRDLETFQAGLRAAETGHLVFGTLHTSSVSGTFGRILDMFPADRHPLIRQGLAANIQAVLCQMLVPSFQEDINVVPAVELMFANAAMRQAIAEGQDGRLTDLIEVGRQEGMRTWTQSFVELIKKGLVEKRVALAYAPNREALEMALRGIDIAQSSIG
ncbi:MAG: PilT/PilU family type 4a pilus ATPase [Candidatus Brocadiia bacterium]